MSPKFIKWHKHKDLEQCASEIHKKLSCKIPIDIDFIVEMVGLELCGINRLKEDFGLYGFLGKVKGQFIIYVQRSDLNLTNYSINFTIAEELSHYLLHSDYFEDVSDLNASYDFYMKISEKSEMKMELDAKHLAAAILLPRDNLKKKAEEVYKDNESIFKKILGKDQDAIIDRIALSLSDDYQVPDGVIARRLKTSTIGFRDFLKRALNNKNS